METKQFQDILRDSDNSNWRSGLQKGGFRKIAEPAKFNHCRHPEHNPPMHISLSPGTYEYCCPKCGNTIQFTVPEILF